MRSLTFVLACALAAAHSIPDRGVLAAGPLTLNSARVTIDGTSNIHAFTAATGTVHVTAVDMVAPAAGADVLDAILQPGALQAFAVTIPASSLTSPKDGIDKNMHKALKVQEHPDIRFRVAALERAGSAHRARGWLTVAGVEKEVVLDLQIERKGEALAVTGTTDLLMTDFGIAPPKAMIGMLKTDPKIRVRIEVLLAAAGA